MDHKELRRSFITVNSGEHLLFLDNEKIYKGPLLHIRQEYFYHQGNVTIGIQRHKGNIILVVNQHGHRLLLIEYDSKVNGTFYDQDSAFYIFAERAYFDNRLNWRFLTS